MTKAGIIQMIYVFKTILDDYFLFNIVVIAKELLASMTTKTDLERVRFKISQQLN